MVRPAPHLHPWRRWIGSGAVAVAGAALVTGCGSTPHAATAQQVQVSVSNCGSGWSDRRAGAQTLMLHDTDSRAGEVQLVDTRGAVYAEVEPIGPGATQPLQVSLSAGTYTLRCAMDDEPAVTGQSVTLTGAAKGTTPGVQPVEQSDLVDATIAYQRYVTGRLPVLLSAVQALQAAIGRGDLDAARSAWLPAQLAYLSMGAAYDAFGDAADQIDARADGFPAGVADPNWRGLLRLQYGLWNGQSAAVLSPLAADLVQQVSQLQQQFSKLQIAPLDIAIRAHEITEDAVGFALTGRDDYGAHAGLAEVLQDVAATRTVLGQVRALLASRYPALGQVEAQLDLVTTDVQAVPHQDGWPAPAALPLADRERIDSDVSELAELLAPVATILEPRRTS